MNESGSDAWFHTQEGERVGPVTLAELEEKAKQGALNPRLDLVWTQGMAEWLPAGEISGLFERRAPPPPPAEGLGPAAVDPYRPPKLDSVEDRMSQEGGWPGARRRSFLLATIVFPFAWNFAFGLGAEFLTGQFGPLIMRWIGIGAAILPVLVGIYYGLMRLVNLGMSRWWYLANLVPFVNLWVGYRCFACPAGYAYHKKLDGAGVMLAIFYWLLMLLCVLLIVAIIAVLQGAIDNPELQQQIGEALRTLRDQASKP